VTLASEFSLNFIKAVSKTKLTVELKCKLSSEADLDKVKTHFANTAPYKDLVDRTCEFARIDPF